LARTKGEKAAHDVQRRFDQYVLDNTRFANTELAKLKPVSIESWRNRLQDRATKDGGVRTDSTLNRDMTSFRAALNLAHADGLVASTLPWRGKLTPIKGADGRRDVYLDRTQRRKLIDAAAPDLALFLRALCLLPLRPGALAALTAGSFDKRLLTLTIGKDKAGKDRKIKLPPATAAVFETATKDKLPTAPLFARADGKAWNKDAWKHPFRDAADAAKLPADATMYVIRHSTITDLVHGGLDLLTVAQISGTSVRMVEQHYGHLRSEVAATALERLAL
jgi:integrase